ncbi:MAG TPA: hypothetical protein VKK79_06380 [Candidatus Lokiarchaeia archaeon]|nr:hypothetical protein [Candidatus Lokiarchaeia archaeon]
MTNVSQKTQQKEIGESHAIFTPGVNAGQYEDLERQVAALRKNVDELARDVKVLSMKGERKWV